jgi:hypothetical protein
MNESVRGCVKMHDKTSGKMTIKVICLDLQKWKILFIIINVLALTVAEC